MPEKTAIRALTLPARMDRNEELLVREAAWWQLSPGDEGYDLPLWTYCGFASLETWNQWKRGMRQ